MESIGFYEYRQAFVENSVDGKELLGMKAADLRSEVMLPGEQSKLVAMEIAELRARHGLGKKLPLAEDWDAAGVVAFLKEMGLGNYAPRFMAAGVTGRKLLGFSEQQVQLMMVTQGASSNFEEEMAAAELMSSLIAQLRWRSEGDNRKQEL